MGLPKYTESVMAKELKQIHANLKLCHLVQNFCSIQALRYDINIKLIKSTHAYRDEIGLEFCHNFKVQTVNRYGEQRVVVIFE